MAATGSGDGHQRLATNQVPSVQVSSATKGTDESTDTVSDAVEPALPLGSSPRLSEPGGEAAESPQTPPSPSQRSRTVGSDGGGETGSTSDSEMEDTEVKREDDSETNEQNVADSQRDDSDMDTDVRDEKGEGEEEDEGEESGGSNLRHSTAEDLDEMMDIGTVDQVEQEAQMNAEEQQPRRRSRRSMVTQSAVVEEEEEETDVKPTIVSPPPSEDQAEDMKVALDQMQSSSSPSSVATGSTGRDSSSPAAMLNGRKQGRQLRPRLQAVKEGTQTSRSTKRSPSPPLVKVKDEPIDDEYDQALISTASTASVKDEPNTAKEDLRIGSVFSTASEAQLPPVQHLSSQIWCFNCKKCLMKGQTAFQRKGSPALFCSTNCLTTSFPSKANSQICYNCQKVIPRPQDVILTPDGKGAMKEFCSQKCLTTFNYNKDPTSHRKAEVTKNPTQPGGQMTLCGVCTRVCITKHEVILSGAVHKICSDACFNRFRSVNKLSMAGCANCGSYCHSKPLMLKLEEGNKTLCNAECLAKYKEKTKLSQPCVMCQTPRLLAETIDNKNDDDSVTLFCSSSCVMAFKVQTVSASGARLNCDNCWKIKVPAYHLAMSDTSIRNFCTLQCVMAFQEKFKKSPKHTNQVFTKLPIGSTKPQQAPSAQSQSSSSGPPKLICAQCTRVITFRPEVIQIKGKLVFVCTVDCSEEFKRANNVTSVCEHCKIEKITGDAKRVDNKDCYFCSDGCKLLFRHELNQKWGRHCDACVYCHCVSKQLVTAQYGGATEDFCSEDCRFKYTMLFCHVAKCDMCGSKGKLRQSLPLLGEVRHFCDLNCLLKFCCHKAVTQGEVQTGGATPVIANVVSLAGPATEDSDVSDGTTQTSSVSDPQNSGPVSSGAPPPSPATAAAAATGPKILKNKALMCRPLVQNKGVSCKTQTATVESQTDLSFPKVMIVPVPVPVYVPVPMSMYSQYTPKPLGLPLPMPVPMFLPVSVNSAERVIETIREIKQKIPADPYEAELVLMAEMVADGAENSKAKEKAEKKTEKKTERREASAPDDRASNYSDDMDADDLNSLLNNWDDGSSESSRSQEKNNNPVADVPVATPSKPSSKPSCPAPPPGPPPMDIEADFTIETLERMSQLRERGGREPSPPPTTSRRRQAQRGKRKPARSKASEIASRKALETPKLKSQYGLDVWKRWIQWRQTQPDLEKPCIGSRPVELKEDVLKCTTAELSYGLCRFIAEVKRPNGERYSPDSLFYLCLGIQQHLFENSRVENIFMDRFYTKFSNEFSSMLRSFKPSITPSGYIHSRVEEDFLWDCKQLGAYSPIVLLNTLLFFCCKYFGFTTVAQHRQLSFAHVMRCTKTNLDNSKTVFLRFYPPIAANEGDADLEVPAKKRKEEESREEILEMVENTENPLRCPVQLYEFYLSKCSESVKQRTNVFYLLPERCCVPSSPLWFSATALDGGTMEAMLTRILTVRELHLGTGGKLKEGERSPPIDSPFIAGEEEDEDSE